MDEVETKRSGCWLVQCRFIPLALMASFASSPISLLSSQYVYQRYAEEAGLTPKNSSFQNNTACVARHNESARDSVQDHVQQQASYFTMYMTIALIVPSLFTMPLWGALSDIVGRKIPIVFACIGNIARVIGIMVPIFFHWPLWIMLVGEALHGIMGYHTGTISYITSAYIADNCPAKSRTFEMVLVDLWLTLGTMVGSMLSGYVLKDIGYDDPVLGYLVPLLCVCVVEVIMIIYTFVALPKFGDPAREMQPSPPNRETFKLDQVIATFKTTVYKSFNVLFNSPRFKQELVIMAVVFGLFGAGGATIRENLGPYVMGYPLCWRALQQAIYKAVELGLHGVVATGVTILWQRTQWSQEWMVLIGIISAMLQNILIGIAKNTFLMYLAVCAGAFGILVYATGRSIAATLVAPSDQGALMAGLSNMENISRLFATVTLNFIYTATLDVYEGIVFFVAATLFIPCIPLMWRIFKLRRRHCDELLSPYAEI